MRKYEIFINGVCHTFDRQVACLKKLLQKKTMAPGLRREVVGELRDS